MGRHYDQLSLEERCEISRLHEDGKSLRQIAAALDRAPSTISRELRRNRGNQVGYQPSYAAQQAKARRWSGARLERDAGLRDLVLGCLARGFSPEQVSGWLARQQGGLRISHESIYRFIYAQIRRTKDYRWRRYLPRAKSKRGWRGRKGGSPASFIRDRRPIAKRPDTANDRTQPGHWEADLMLFKTYGQAVLVAHERTSRLIILARQPNKAAAPTAQRLLTWFTDLPDYMRRTITFDNGTEFAQHYKLTKTIQMQTFFCDPHAPWQKGGVENAIGRMRRYLPRKTDLATLSTQTLNTYVAAYNNTPRKCLDYLSPAEAFLKLINPLHFKCESTFPPPPE